MEATAGDALPLSCQTHVLGRAVIPQKLRSFRKVRPASPDACGGPWKRQRTSDDDSDTSEAAIAELLLGLSHSPRSSSSPRESEVSSEAEDLISLCSPKKRTSGTLHRQTARSQPSRRAQELDISKSEGLDEDFEADSEQPQKPAKVAKRLSGRCKCGKRVSASHPPCKSELMLLCERFCERCGHAAAGSETRIHLNECAVALGVPRRRLYDITIVYEAVEVVKRTGKLAYVWRGLSHLPALVEQLRQEEADGLPVADRKGNSLLSQDSGERQTTHSLWTLSRKFIRLLLTTKGPIQLTDAAEHLIGEHLPAKRQQTQVTVERRLYDIGSILATLNLIHRTYVEGKRQPAFSWNWDRTPEAPLASASAGAAVAVPKPVTTNELKSPAKAAGVSMQPSRPGVGDVRVPSTVNDRTSAPSNSGAAPSLASLAKSKLQSLPVQLLSPMPGPHIHVTSDLSFPGCGCAVLPPLPPLVLPPQLAAQLHCVPSLQGQGPGVADFGGLSAAAKRAQPLA